jgi:TPP-dependent indolepyruvate ferredoxin oxidoreductase alpha subunit
MEDRGLANTRLQVRKAITEIREAKYAIPARDKAMCSGCGKRCVLRGRKGGFLTN